MKCKKAERMILRSLDGLLSNEEMTLLEGHIRSCPACQTKKEEYQGILDALKEEEFPEPKPYFWERLQFKLNERKRYEPLSLWKQWGLRAIPISFLIVVLLATAILLFMPPKEEELAPSLSQSGILLFQNTNPLQETQPILEQEGAENKSMMLIFTSLAEKNGIRRQFP